MSINEFNMPEKIFGERVELAKRDHNHDDETWKAINNNRTFLRKYLGWVDGTTTFDSVIKSTEHFLDTWNKKEKFAYVILDKNTAELIGMVDIHDINLSYQVASIGYWIKENKTKKGYMTEAVNLIEKEIFKNKIHRLEIRCDIENDASANVAIRCGYEYEATLKDALMMRGEHRSQKIYVKFNS